MPKQYDVLIIGAGHNGLTAAAYLAKKGKSVLVLERRAEAGGVCLPVGQRAGSMLLGGKLRDDIVRELNLGQYGYPAGAAVAGAYVSALPDGKRLQLSADVKASMEAIAQFSEEDAKRWPEFVAFLDRAAFFLDQAYRTPMPRLPKFPLADGLPLAALGLKLRGMGSGDMHRVIRLLAMSVREFLDEWFVSGELKAAIAALGIHNASLGVMSAGSGFNLMHQYLVRGGWAQPLSANGAVVPALYGAASAAGVQFRFSAGVKEILVSDGQAVGMLLENGEELRAGKVISTADPRSTLLGLLRPEHLDPEFAWSVRHIKMRGVTAKLFLEVEGSVALPGTLAVAPSLNYLEKAYDAAKYGQISAQPYLELTAAEGVVSVHVQFAPYALKNSTWDEASRARLERAALDTLLAFVPEIHSKIKSVGLVTPPDLAADYALTEGDMNQGQLMIDQFLFMRPLPGWSEYKTPVGGLYLGGSGVHGGGGVSGMAGRNAAHAVLKD